MFLKRLVLVLLSILSALLLAEWGLRMYFETNGTEDDRIRYLYSHAEIRARRSRMTGAPYVTYGLTPGYPTQNSRGFRGGEVATHKTPGVFRIVALGGSTTYGDHIARWEDAYPAQLERILRERHHAVEVINAGVPGYSSWELLISFAFRILDLHPDVIVIYEAINDVFPRLVRPSQYDGMATSKGIWRTPAPAVPPSALYRVLAVRLGWIDDPVSLEVQFDRSYSAEYCRFNADYTRCDNFDMTPEAVLAANPPTYFERNLRNLIAVATSNKVKVMLSSWAYYPKPIPEVRDGTFMTLPFVQNAVAEHNGILQKIALDSEIPYYDLASALPADRTFWIEGMHMTPAGAREQAILYADFMTSSRLVP